MATKYKQEILKQVARATFVVLACALLLGAIVPISVGAQTFKTLYKFKEQDAASGPNSALVWDAAGNLYGTAGGSPNGEGNGAVFELSPSGEMTFLYTFPGTNGNGENGAQPQGVVFGTDGNLYGDTYDGGYNNYGVIFKLTLSGQFTLLYNFQGSPNDGVAPISTPLLPGPSGLFYGATAEGGDGLCRGENRQGFCGVVFTVDTSGNETVIHDLQGSPGDGVEPFGNLVQDVQGNLYGATMGGGAYPGLLCGGLSGWNCGAVIKLSPSSGGGWTESLLHSFTGGSEGLVPLSVCHW